MKIVLKTISSICSILNICKNLVKVAALGNIKSESGAIKTQSILRSHLISLGVSSSSYFFFSFLRKTSQMMRMRSRTPNETPTTAPATTPMPRTSKHTEGHFCHIVTCHYITSHLPHSYKLNKYI